MKMTDAVVVWTPETDECRVERHHGNWTRTAGDRWMPAARLGSYGEINPDDEASKLLAMFLLFNTVTVRDAVDVKAAHKAFLGIDEYRRTISPDIEGAD